MRGSENNHPSEIAALSTDRAAATQRQLILVVPCFNEEERLDLPSFGSFIHDNPGTSILFVDDGSSDRTWECLEAARKSIGNQIMCHRLRDNHGKGEAVRRGLLAALELNPVLTGFWDADLAIPLAEIAGFTSQLEHKPQLAAVFGSRSRLLSDPDNRRRLRRHLGRFGSRLIAWILDTGISDTQCGAKLFRCTPTLNKALARPFISRWLFDVELILRLRETLPSTALVEHPLSQCSDVQNSRIRTLDYLKGLIDLWRIRREYRPVARRES